MGTNHGEVHWTELNTHEPEKAAEFYAATLGWTIETVQMPDMAPYRVGKLGDQMVAGIFEMTDPEMADLHDEWLTYFAVSDADASAKVVVEAGGRIMRPPTDVPGVGRFIILKDVGGAVCAFMQPGGAN